MEARVEGPQTPFEVYCYRCKTSFAAGTRRCIHCGGPIGRRQRIPVALQGPARHDEEIFDEELPTRGSRVSPTAMLWIALALFGALYRACAGGGG